MNKKLKNHELWLGIDGCMNYAQIRINNLWEEIKKMNKKIDDQKKEIK